MIGEPGRRPAGGAGVRRRDQDHQEDFTPSVMVDGKFNIRDGVALRAALTGTPTGGVTDALIRRSE